VVLPNGPALIKTGFVDSQAAPKLYLRNVEPNRSALIKTGFVDSQAAPKLYL
jgi:hypothetical protein